MSAKFYSLHRLFTPQRMRYPWFIGGALWAGWLLSLLLGKGNLDLNGHLVGTDFVAFYTAGKIILAGQADQLYSLELARAIQTEIYGAPSDNFNPYLNPPHFALLVTPFALLPYPWSPILWMSLGVLLLWVGIRWLAPEKPGKVFLYALSWLPVFYAVSFGQNTFLSLAVLSLTFALWVKGRHGWAGLALSLLAFKPQFMLGAGLLWLLDWRRSWRALASLAAGVALQAGLSAWLLPEASLDYLRYVQKINANLMNVPGFPMWNAWSLQAFWLALLPGAKWAAQALYGLCALFGLYAFVKFWRANRQRDWALFAGALALQTWAIPYLMVYDWSILLIPALLIWKYQPGLRRQLAVIYALVWIVSFFSNALTFLQLKYLGAGLQISIPALTIALLLLYPLLMRLAAPETPAPDGS